MRTIFVHHYSGILSAVGIGLADVVVEEQVHLCPCPLPAPAWIGDTANMLKCAAEQMCAALWRPMIKVHCSTAMHICSVSAASFCVFLAYVVWRELS